MYTGTDGWGPALYPRFADTTRLLKSKNTVTI